MLHVQFGASKQAAKGLCLFFVAFYCSFFLGKVVKGWENCRRYFLIWSARDGLTERFLFFGYVCLC